MAEVRWSFKASKDFNEAREWYAEIRPALGTDFEGAVFRLLTDIATAPLRFAVVHKGKRRAQLQRFPYALYFLLEADAIVVVACFHAKRDPRIWQQR